MKVHVICMNDSIRFAVVEDEVLANAKLIELKAEYYERNKGLFRSYQAYIDICYWHIHTVDGL